MAGDGIGSVSVEVVPNATAFWRRFEAATKGQATEAGRQAGQDWQRGFNSATHAKPVTPRVNTSGARRDLQNLSKDTKNNEVQFRSLIGTAVTLAPALLPLAGAAGAAGIELATMGAVGIIAFKGIQAEIKKGTKAGTQYAGIIKQVKAETASIKSTVAIGILPGLDSAAAKLKADLPQVNALLKQQSAYLGDTISHLTGGLLGGLHTFAPVLNQIGTSILLVSAHFERWATGPGGAKFAQTLSADYNRVAPIIVDVAHAVEHLVVAAHPIGLGVLSGFGLLAKAVSAFPTPALEAIVAGFTSFRIIGSITGRNPLTGLTSAWTTYQARQGAAVASTAAANLQLEASNASAAASAAAAASVEATARAETAAAYAATQAEIAASVAGQEGELSGLAAATVAAAAEQAAALQGVAVAAQVAAGEAAAASAEIGLAAETAAAESVAASEAASFSWTGLLGPVGVAVGALGLLGLSFLGSGQDAAKARQDIQGYVSALQQTQGAINDTVRAQVAKNLSDAGAFAAASKLGISQGQLVDSVLGVGGAYSKVTAIVDKNTPAFARNAGASKGLAEQFLSWGGATQSAASAAGLLYVTLQQQRDAFKQARQAAINQQAAVLGAGNATAYYQHRVEQADTALTAWLTALNTFNKSANTAADRAALIGAALVAANGDLLAFANTMVSAATANQTLVTDFKHLHKGVLDLKTGTLDYHNAAAAPLLSDLAQLQTAAEGAAAATYQHELRTRGGKRAAQDAFAVYKNDTRGALIDEATQLGLTSGQAKKLADQYFGIKNSGDLKKRIELLGQDKVLRALRGILADLDILAGKHVTSYVDIVTTNRDFGTPAPHGGGRIIGQAGGSGPGGMADGWAWVGDPGPASELIHKSGSRVDVFPHSKSVAMARSWGANIPAFQSGSQYGSYSLPGGGGSTPPPPAPRPGGEQGGFTGVNYGGGGSSSGSSSGSGSGSSSSSSPAQHTGPTFAMFRALAHDLNVFGRALSGTAQQAHQAFGQLIADIRKLGADQGLVSTLRNENAKLHRLIQDRNRDTAQLTAVTAKYNQVVSASQQAIKSSFDITTAGVAPTGGAVTGSNIIAQELQAATKAKRFVADIKALSGKISNQYLQQLAAKGPDALPEAEALRGLSAGQLRTLRTAEGEINAAGVAAGRFVGNRLYGSQMAELRHEQRVDNRQIDRLANRMEHQLERAADRIAGRPVLVIADGKVIARVVNNANRHNGRR